jgi:hypothetical protein
MRSVFNQNGDAELPPPEENKTLLSNQNGDEVVQPLLLLLPVPAMKFKRKKKRRKKRFSFNLNGEAQR